MFVGVLARRRHGGRRRDVVERASVLWVDCDTAEAVASLEAFRPAASMVVASGGPRRRHAYWLLAESVAVEAIERANRRLAWALRADPQCSEPARILRPAGSLCIAESGRLRGTPFASVTIDLLVLAPPDAGPSPPDRTPQACHRREGSVPRAAVGAPSRAVSATRRVWRNGGGSLAKR